MISIMAAMSQDRVIGNDLAIPWHISKDLKRLKKITYGKKIIMGRRTFDSLKKPLPNREHIVLSRSKTKCDYPEVKFYSSYSFIDEYVNSDEEVFVLGGGEIYKELLKYTSKLYLTIILNEYKGNIYFPEIDYEKWDLIEEENESENGIDFVYKTYNLKKVQD